MRTIRFAIRNLRCSTDWLASPGLLDFVKSRKRLPKRIRQRADEAVAYLKGIGWLKPKKIEVETIRSVSIDIDQMERFIMENHSELIKSYGCRGSVLIMGRAEFYELTKQTINHPWRFSMTDFQDGHNHNRFHGLFVVVLPWMDGTLLVPKEYLPIDREFIPSGIMVTAETQRKLVEESFRAGKATK